MLVSLFHRDPGSALEGTPWLGATPDLDLTARTYNQTSAGTFGRVLPALTAAEGFGKMVVGVIPQLKKSQGFRSNLGVLNLSPFDVVAVVRLWDRNGDQVGSTWNPNVKASGHFQRDDVSTAVGAGSTELACATVEVLTTGGRIRACGPVVDNATGDPTTIPALVPRGAQPPSGRAGRRGAGQASSSPRAAATIRSTLGSTSRSRRWS